MATCDCEDDAYDFGSGAGFFLAESARDVRFRDDLLVQFLWHYQHVLKKRHVLTCQKLKLNGRGSVTSVDRLARFVALRA